MLPLLLLVGMSAQVMSQIKLTDQFGNLKTVQVGTEPWNVAGGTIPASSNTQDIYQTGRVSVGAISTLPVANKAGQSKFNIVNFSNASSVSGLGTIAAQVPFSMLSDNSINGVIMENTTYPTGNRVFYMTKYISRLAPGDAAASVPLYDWATLTDAGVGKSTILRADLTNGNIGFGDDIFNSLLDGELPTENLDLHRSARIRNLYADGQAVNGFIRSTVIGNYTPEHVVTADANGVLGKKTLASIAEPWNVQGGTVAANLNTQNIYQSGSVAVGRNNAYTNTKFHVEGAGTLGQSWGSQMILTDNGSTNAIMGLNIKGVYANFIGLDRNTSKFYITAANGDATRNALSNASIVVDAANSSGVGGFVGLNTASPSQRLDVNGNARIQVLTNGTSDAAYTRTVISTNDGTLGYTSGTPLTTSKIINYVLTKAAGTDVDWIQNYDTKIDALKYDVMVLSIRFKGTTVATTSNTLAFVPFDESIVPESNTWRIKLDYAAAGAAPGGQGTWDVVLAVMPKGQAVKIVQSIGDTGAAVAAPAGL